MLQVGDQPGCGEVRVHAGQVPEAGNTGPGDVRQGKHLFIDIGYATFK